MLSPHTKKGGGEMLSVARFGLEGTLAFSGINSTWKTGNLFPCGLHGLSAKQKTKREAPPRFELIRTRLVESHCKGNYHCHAINVDTMKRLVACKNEQADNVRKQMI